MALVVDTLHITDYTTQSNNRKRICIYNINKCVSKTIEHGDTMIEE